MQIFQNASANQESAAFDATSKTAVSFQASVSGADPTAGTLKASVSLDGVEYDATNTGLDFTFTEILANETKISAQGFPFIKWTIASLAFTYKQTHTGVGLSDLALAGTYTPLTGHTYDIKISTAAVPDKFQWRKDGGAYSAEITITGGSQAIADGLAVTFTATTGHTLNDSWLVEVPNIDLVMQR